MQQIPLTEPLTRKAAWLAANPPPGPAPKPDMVWVPGGTFMMGSDAFYPEERPARPVTVTGFWMDTYPVTVADFRNFVRQTGHVTLAERSLPDPRHPAQTLPPHGLVFTQPKAPVALNDPAAWWAMVEGADWRRPTGPKGARALDRHPVTQIAYADACAYLAWAGKRLPTEAEWEFAARGGLDGAIFAWGNRELSAAGKRQANTWQGRFPDQNTREDGFLLTSPVGHYGPQGWGLCDMTGNVWEWTQTDWRQSSSQRACCAASQGPREKVIKGGSHLCAPNYCFRYRPAARVGHADDAPTSHVGFRGIIAPAPQTDQKRDNI